MHYSEYQGVYYIEGTPDGVSLIKPIETELNQIFGQSQLKSLDDIKEKLNHEVRSLGGNCVYDFKYGQKSTFWKGLFGMDDVHWYANGKIGVLQNPASLG